MTTTKINENIIITHIFSDQNTFDHISSKKSMILVINVILFETVLEIPLPVKSCNIITYPISCAVRYCASMDEVQLCGSVGSTTNSVMTMILSQNSALVLCIIYQGLYIVGLAKCWY